MHSCTINNLRLARVKFWDDSNEKISYSDEITKCELIKISNLQNYDIKIIFSIFHSQKHSMPILIHYCNLWTNSNRLLRSDIVLDNFAVCSHTKEVSLAAILNNYSHCFNRPLLTDTENIPIASNLENVPHGVCVNVPSLILLSQSALLSPDLTLICRTTRVFFGISFYIQKCWFSYQVCLPKSTSAFKTSFTEPLDFAIGVRTIDQGHSVLVHVLFEINSLFALLLLLGKYRPRLAKMKRLA